MSQLEITGLKKYFKVKNGELHAVDGVSMSIQKGQTIGVVGESGCGKSTLGKTILRLTEPTDGSVVFEGREITKLSAHKFKKMRMEMQMIFQDPFASLDPRMTVSQLIAEPLVTYRIHSQKGELREHVNQLMETVGLDKRFKDSYPHELDGGRRQRIGIARALALEPKFVVCDEPVSALDVSIQAQILNLLKDLQQETGITFMFITHNLSVVRHVSDEICVMYLGQIIEQCLTDELFENTLHPYSNALLSAIPVPRIKNRPKRIILRGEITSPVNPKPQCRFAPRCNFADEECMKRQPPLQDAGNGHLVACFKYKQLQEYKTP